VHRKQIYETVRIEVTDPNGADFTGFVQFFHRPPRSINITVGLVDEIKVEVIQPQLVHGALEGSFGTFIAGVLHPKLGCNKQLFAINSALLDGLSHGLLVPVGGGGIEQAVSGLDGIDNSRRLVRLGVRTRRA
jgi:hypothetical protein